MFTSIIITAMPIHFINDARLPSAYQEVGYIEGNWTQWIDTWVTPKSNTKSQIKFRNLWVTWDVIYWMNDWNDNADYRLFNYNSQIYWDLKDQRAYGSTCSANTDYEFEIWNNYVKNVWWSSNLVSWNTVSWYTWSSSIKLNKSKNSWNVSSNRRYYVKIWEWNTQIRNMIPCYRKSDNVIWMYDTVNNQFYTNSWTGTFTKWANATQENLSRLYIWDKLIVWGECWYNFQWQLDLKSDTFWRPFHIFHKIWNDFVSLNSDMAQYPTIYWIRVDANWNILKSNAVSSPIRYSWYPNWSLHPVNKTIFIRSEWDWWVYNYDTDNLTIWSLVMNYWSWYWNSYCVSSDWKLIAYWWNEVNTSQKYIIVNWTSYWSMNNRPWASWSWNSVNCIDDNWNIYVQLRNTTWIYKCRVDSNRALQYTKIWDAQSWYGISNGQSSDFPVIIWSWWFQIWKDWQLSSVYSRSRSRSERHWTWIWNYVCITDNGSWYTDIYIFKTTDLSNPIYTNTISYEVQVWWYPWMNWFILSWPWRTYFLH